MALPLLRCCSCKRTVSILIRSFTSKSFSASQSRRLVPVSSAVCDVRQYCSDRERPNQRRTDVIIRLTNPLIWLQTRLYFLLIRMYFDKEFSAEEFMKGAKQAFLHVSKLLSQCKFEALEGLVAEDLIRKLEEKCAQLPLSHQRALFVESDAVAHTSTEGVAIYYDDSGRKYVSVLMRFWYWTTARLPNDNITGVKVFQFSTGGEKPETKRLVAAIYEFQREFTQGVTPDWIITRIEHSKLLY
ncbi:m-AAA protease-interacting protein 1, mitochondrial [Puntigrus tetrazona]|uniref:m-AAA protease-interacting protein 1, mitochondrial n=1 Tax=Puntigrus tetrazona TaxID=1606681 RepID=UPI001C8A5FC1|nr:m-AAA protease-interacting protein 1, mitochondrial [Puntigrus tetrazona]